MPTQRSDDRDQTQPLLRLAMEGDKEAFGSLYEQYLDEVYRYVYFRVGSECEAEDITADAFLKTWEYLPRLSQQGSTIRNFRSWLYGVAKNLVTDYYRKEKPIALPDNAHDGEDPVRRTAEEKRELRQLAEAIMQLSPDYRQVIVLRFVNELSHRECAAVMGRTIGQTRVLQYRALKKLREVIDDGRVKTV